MRLFFAIAISDEVRQAIADLQTELRPRLRTARWVPARNLHLTLRFLGESDPGVASELERNLPERVAGVAPFSLCFRGCGVFPNPSRPRVLWVGLDEPDARLFKLYALLEDEVRSQGFEAERRPFRPHLTVARFKRPDRSLSELGPPILERAFGESDVSEVVLLESRLGREGASYHVAKRFALGRTEREELV